MKLRRLLTGIALTAAISLLLVDNTLQAQRWQQLYQPLEHSPIPCRIMPPIELKPDVKYPVIVSLHGAGGKGIDNKKQLKTWNMQLTDDNVRNRFPCYVVAPQTEVLWNEIHYQAIKQIINNLPHFDKSRIYLLGHSMGGHGTYIFLQFEKDYFAAAAPSAGTGLRSTEQFIDPQKIRDYPIWAFHGDKDKVCPFEKQQRVFEQLRSINGNLKLTIWVGDNHGVAGKFITGAENGKTLYTSHRCDREIEFLVWLFKQRRK